MQRINQAWETLSSPAARARYDAEAAAPSAAAYPHWGGAQRAYQPSYAAQPAWRATQAAYTRGSHARRRRRPAAVGSPPRRRPRRVLLAALFGGLVPLPIIGLLLFFVARTVFRAGD